MAEKRITNVEKKPVKPIILKNDIGDIYVLEFNRNSIRFAETHGFKVQVLEQGISLSGIEDLFYYAFRMHHPTMTQANSNRILYEELGGLRDGMLERLIDLYLAPFNTLVNDDAEKNSKMTVEL